MLTHSLTHSLARSLTHSLAHSLTHSLSLLLKQVSTKKAVLWLGPVGQQPVSAAAPISLASSIDTGAERVPAKKSINLACSADTGAERVPAKKSINLVSNTNASVGRSRYEKDINPYAKAPRASALAAAGMHFYISSMKVVHTYIQYMHTYRTYNSCRANRVYLMHYAHISTLSAFKSIFYK